MPKHAHDGTPFYKIQSKAFFSFAAQTFEFASQTLGYRNPSSYTTTNEEESFPSSSRAKDEQSGLDVYTLSEVALHDTLDDCWIILYDKIFDVTRFLLEHPGGEDVIMENAGRDATIAFRGVGHSLLALQALDDYLVGMLPQEEKIYTGEGPCRWSTL